MSPRRTSYSRSTTCGRGPCCSTTAGPPPRPSSTGPPASRSGTSSDSRCGTCSETPGRGCSLSSSASTRSSRTTLQSGRSSADSPQGLPPVADLSSSRTSMTRQAVTVGANSRTIPCVRDSLDRMCAHGSHPPPSGSVCAPGVIRVHERRWSGAHRVCSAAWCSSHRSSGWLGGGGAGDV